RKGSSDKRRWSFSRRSASQGVIIHTAFTNTPANNDSRDLVSTYLPATQLIAPEKSSLTHNDEEINLSVKGHTALRRSSAQGELAELKMLVKLQAAVRGHLVRQHAAGSLHCIRATVKIQALARACYGKSLDKSEIGEKVQDKYEITRELLESTPNTKHRHIKCDPSSPSPAWLWMDHWISFASPIIDGSEMEIKQEQKVMEKNMPSHEEHGKVFNSDETCDSKGAVYGPEMNYLVSLEPIPTAHSPEDIKEELKPVNAATSTELKASRDMVPEPNQNGQSDTELQAELKAPHTESEIKTKPFVEKFSLDSPDMGRKNVTCGSRKSTNPSFIAAQSKFKELSSAVSIKSYHPFQQDAEYDSNADTAKTSTAITNMKMGFSQSDRSPKFAGGSEGGAELSITSSLDSPDGYCIELSKPRVLEDDGKIPDEGSCNAIKDEALSSGDTSIFLVQQEKHNSGERKSGDDKTDNRMVEKKAEEKLPRSLLTAPGSQRTPSSQLVARSVKLKNSGLRKSTDSVSFGRKTSLSSARDFSDKQLHQKVDRRRSSFGYATSDLFELEGRDSSGSISMPSYMKATVSAKARLIASTSPRLSLDVYEKDMNPKKRHSLPVANGMQIPPKLQQPPKGSGTCLKQINKPFSRNEKYLKDQIY
uniref:DUF4005 domain-containing protein n=1 Tax=Kalanchoe fedtschenkoi TaxID=63787 RepID=A0A7N1A9N0_KALFE